MLLIDADWWPSPSDAATHWRMRSARPRRWARVRHLARGVVTRASAWSTAVAFAAASVVLFAAAPMVAEWLGHRFTGVGAFAVYAAPAVLFVFMSSHASSRRRPRRGDCSRHSLGCSRCWRGARWRPATWRCISSPRFSASPPKAPGRRPHLTIDHLPAALQLYAAFAVFYLGVPLSARRIGRPLVPAWGGGAVLISSLLMLLYLALAIAVERRALGTRRAARASRCGHLHRERRGSATVALRRWWSAVVGRARRLVEQRRRGRRALALAAGADPAHDRDACGVAILYARRVTPPSRGRPYGAEPISDSVAISSSSSSPSNRSGRHRPGRCWAR